MQNTDNKRLVKIILDYTKTELPEQKVEELVERLMQKPNAQDILFLSTLGISIYSLIQKVTRKTIDEIHHAILNEGITKIQIQKCILEIRML